MKLVVFGNEFRENMGNREEAISKLFSEVRDHGEKETLDKCRKGMKVVRKLIEDKGKDLMMILRE